MNLPELTAVQQSAAATGRRFFRVAPSVYASLREAVDTSRGYPVGSGTAAQTLQGLPDPTRLRTDPNGNLLISLEAWRFTASDNSLLAPAIAAGTVTELTAAQFTA